ncbi:phage tail spike protein [Bacillus thuringiensis]
MRQIVFPTLYEMKETNFSHNGLGVLKDAISCTVTEERNGIFELELEYPVSSPLYKYLVNGNIIKARANENMQEQLFRIATTNPDIDNTITVFAQHISYDLLDNFVEKVSVKDSTASTFLSTLTAAMAYKTPFVLSTDIQSSNSTSLEDLNPLQALAGIRGSFIDTWGGEFERDNFNFRIKKARGADNGVLISYRKNLTGLDVEVDVTGLATRIYPFANIDAQGDNPAYKITLPEKYVDSPYINNYPFPKIIPLDLSEKAKAEGGKKPPITNPDELRKFAQKYLKESGIDIPKTNVKVEFIPLWQTEEYKNFAILERVGLTDTVTVRHEGIGVDIKVKVIKTEFNSLTGQYNKIELGNAKANFSNDSSDKINEMGNNLSNQIKGQNSNLQNAIDHATDLITGADGGYIRLNPKEKPSELLIMDTPDIKTAKKIWRWNMGGLGFSSTGYNGKFGTAITQDGQIVADYITTGTLDAGIVKAGTLASQDGTLNLNMGNGALKINHKDGSYSEMSADGFKYYYAGTDSTYMHITESFVHQAPSTTGEEFTVYVPRYYHGKDYTVVWQMGNVQAGYAKSLSGYEVNVIRQNKQTGSVTCAVKVWSSQNGKPDGYSLDPNAVAYIKLFTYL